MRKINALQTACARATFIAGTLCMYLRHPWLVLQFIGRLGYPPHVCDPRTKHEKLLWRKIFDRNPLFPVLADKLAVRAVVADRCPGLRFADVLWSSGSAAEMPVDLIEPGVVIKTNNGSGRNIVVGEKPADLAAIRDRVDDWLRKPYAAKNGEWPYRLIPPRAFIERRLVADGGAEFVDISCHVAGGRCLFVNIDRDAKQEQETVGLFTAEGRRLSARVREGRWREPYPELPHDYRPPANLPQAVEHAIRLAGPSDYVRVDFMSAGDELCFCECTLFPIGGFSVISGGIDEQIAAAWDLRGAWFMTEPQPGLLGPYARLLRHHGHDARRAVAAGS
jgi:hypothetical protein